MSGVSAIIICLFGLTFGVLIAEFILRGGLETINVEDSMIWVVIYSFLLLPVTVPLGKFIVGWYYKAERANLFCCCKFIVKKFLHFP